ncbi:MAG: hypothetical protein N4A40_07635, partial [Tissierellales bacterium]|nr:hypothetical protein [Tissierellales bacterium]
MIRRDKFKLSIWILAIISVVLLGNVAFAEEMIPRGVIKSDYVVGDKSTAEHVYYGEIYDIDDDCISVRAQDDFSQKKFELSVSNEELKTHLVNLDEGRILRNVMYRLYLKDDIRDDAELLAIEKVVGEKNCGKYYLSAKIGDRWIFGYGPNRNYNSESNDTHIKYFSLKISEEFLKEYSDYYIDEVFEKFSHIPIKTFIDDDGNLSGFFGDGEKKDIDDCYWYLERKAIVGSEPITIFEKNFSNFRVSGDSAAIDFDDESDVEIELNQDSMDLERNQKYTGRFLNENGKMILLNVKEIVDDTKDDDDMDLKGELDDCENIVFIKDIDDGEVEYVMMEDTRGQGATGETDSSNLDGEFYVLDREDMNGEKLSDSYEKVRKENLNIETGQIIYTELEYIDEIEELSESAHVILKNSPKYHVNSGENCIKRVHGEGFYEKEYLKIEDNDLIDLENLEMAMGLADDKWEYFDGYDVLKYYNLDSEFDCTLIRSPIKTDEVVGILFENLAKKAEYSSKMMGKVSDIKDYKDRVEMSVDLAGKIHKFKGYKDKIDLSEIESNDLILAYYQNDEIIGYRMLDEDDIEEKIAYLNHFGDENNLTFRYCYGGGYSSELEVLDEKTFDDIEQAIENENRLIRIKTVDDGILLDYEVAGNIDEKRVYRILDHDENSVTFGFGASINTLDSDFKEEQKERIEFGRDFKISKYIDDYNEASIALDDEGKLQFLLYDVESSFSYSSISPSGSKTISNKILLFGKSKLYTNRSEMLKGRIMLYGDAGRNFKANQNIDDIEIYSMDIKNFSTPIELDVKDMRDLKNKYVLKEVSALDLDEYTEYERPILFEEQDSKIHSIVFINSQGDGIKGHFEGEQEFVDVSGNSYKIDEKILYGEESYFTEDFIDKYENEFELHLIKDKKSDTYFAEITKATLKKSEMKTGIFIINDIDDGETEFISDDGRYFNLIEEETEQVVLDKLYNDFSRSDMVKLKYQIADRRYIIIEEIELVYEP